MNTTALPEGRVIKGRYKILKPLGSGGMGAVYLAEDNNLDGKFVAIKEMHEISDEMEKAKDIGQFVREAGFLTSLDHPNLPKLYEFFLDEGRPYLVMEYIDGKTLQKILDESLTPLKEKEVLNWAIQICEVLNYLHTWEQTPIIFRDLKLENIILDKENKIKLIDFGIAREFSPRKNTDTIRMGSVGYAPPEQYAKGGQTDVRTDLYALGVCLHTLLTKNDPSTTPFSFQDAAGLNPFVSVGLNSIIKKALEIKPEKRFQTSMEMLRELKKEIPAPDIRIIPDIIELGEITTGDEKSITVMISNSRSGLLSGKLQENLPEGIRLSFTHFQGNYQELIIHVNSLKYEPEKNYTQTITFLSNGGNGEIKISFKIVFPKTSLEADVSFLDFGTLKYERETFEEITVYNTGAGTLKGKISSPQEWIVFNPITFNSNEERIKVSVDSSKLPQGNTVYEGTIIIESNGGNIIINSVLFLPVLSLSPDRIDLGIISEKKHKDITLNINNTGRGVMKGRINCKESWVSLSSNLLEGNYNQIDIRVEPKELKKGIKHKAQIEIQVNGSSFSLPLTVEPYSLLKTIFKGSLILLLVILFILSNHIRYNLEQKAKFDFISRLSKIPGCITYFTTTDNQGKIYVVRPDGNGKTLVARGYYPRWSPDGKNILFSSAEGQIKFFDLQSGRDKNLVNGINPVWSPDGKQIAFEQEGGIIQIINLEILKPIPLIYGKSPSWDTTGERLVYDDGGGVGSSVKLISLKDSIPRVLGNGFNPLWSPDGSHIVYNADMRTLAIMEINKTRIEEIFEGEEPAWSSDGKLLAFQHQDIIYIINRETGQKKKIIPGTSPSWFVDDKYLAFRTNNGIYIIELATGMTYQISSSGHSPRWSRGGL